MEIALNICHAITTGILLHGITVYGWTSKKNISKINTALNICFRTASGLLRTTPIQNLRNEAKFLDFQTLMEKRSIVMAARANNNTSR